MKVNKVKVYMYINEDNCGGFPEFKKHILQGNFQYQYSKLISI